MAPTSYADDQTTTTIETSALLASLASPSPSPHVHVQPVNPLLPTTPPTCSSGLTKSLGSAPFSAGGFDASVAPAEGVFGGGGGAKNLSGVYNPFDSDGKEVSPI